MRVSVIVPTCNDDLRLEWALEGLRRQTYHHFEVIVCNDGGHPATEHLVRRFGHRYVYLNPPSEEFRAGAARNEGVRHSDGDLLLFQDQDIVADPDWVASYVRHYDPQRCHFGLRRRLPLHLVRPYDRLDHEWLRANSVDDPLTYRIRIEEAGIRCRFWSCNLGVPASLFCALGGFNEEYVGYGAEDLDLACRIWRWKGECITLLEDCWVTHLDHPPVVGTRSPHQMLWDKYLHATSHVRNGGPLSRNRTR